MLLWAVARSYFKAGAGIILSWRSTILYFYTFVKIFFNNIVDICKKGRNELDFFNHRWSV